MFDWIKDVITATGSLLSPLVICHAWQGGVILRWGRFHRAITPGYYAKWPLAEDVVLFEACESTMRLPVQSLTTSDDKSVEVSSIVKYEIKDARKYVCDVWDQKDVLADVTAGAVSEWVQSHTYAELMQGTPEKQVLTKVKYGVGKYGFQVNQVTFPDKAKGRNVRLFMTSSAKDLDN
jgi:regulator of protease activity HflC (stomatin/prohibitin superfamily)